MMGQRMRLPRQCKVRGKLVVCSVTVEVSGVSISLTIEGNTSGEDSEDFCCGNGMFWVFNFWLTSRARV